MLALFAVTITVHAQTITFISAANPEPRDVPLIDRMKGWGFTVQVHPADGVVAHPVNVAGSNLVYISETVASGNVLAAYRNVAVPVINSEAFTWDDLGYTTTPLADFDDTLEIAGTHPIVTGLSGQVKVSNALTEMMSGAALTGNPTVLATSVVNGNPCIAVYGSGNSLRILFFLHSNMIANLTDSGWRLVERAVRFATNTLTPVDPQGSLHATWSAIKAEYR